MKNVLLKELMVKNPATLDIDAPFRKVAELFLAKRIRHLPVLDKEKKLVGIISQRDLNQVAAPRRTLEGEYIYDTDILDRFILQRIMVKEVAALKADDTLSKALELLIDRKIGCIPIIDHDNRVIGILSYIDVLQAVRNEIK